MTPTLKLPSRALVWLLACLTVVPFAMTAIASLKSPADLLSGVFSLPSGPHFANYRNAWVDGHFGTYFLNSVIVVVPVVTCSIVLGGLAGFAMALLRMPGKPWIAGILAVGMVMPTEAFIIPLYHEMHWLGLTNTYAALILPQIAQSLPFSTLFLATAMSEVPREIVEAAVLDGAPRRKVLVHLLLPLLASPIATLGLFLFIWTWNEFLLPLILVNDERVRTLPVGMLFFQGRNTVNIPVLMAGAIITIIPIVAVFLTFQRRFISGLTNGSGK